MRHRKKGRIFGREAAGRLAMLKGLAASFFARGRVTTTEARARELRPLVEHMIARARKPTLANRRLARKLLSPKTTTILIARAEKLASRPGGFTRLVKLPLRKSDRASMAMVELVLQ